MHHPATIASPRNQGSALLWVAGLCILIPGAILLQTAMLLAIGGMLPTIVTLFTDHTPGRYRLRTVALLNLAGVVAVVKSLYQAPNVQHATMQAAADPLNWLLMLGGAAIGVGLLKLLPQLSLEVAEVLAERQIQIFQSRQRTLVDEWGEGVQSGVVG